jgi:UDP-N-acetyl-2-amino-2-deoxyglucuronate dehydrogenase
MISKQKYHHSIIGCGRIAQNHFDAAVENNMEISLCVDKDIKKAREFASKNHIKNYSSDYFDVLKSNKISSVSICTDHLSHTKIAKDIFEHSHLIIEKPLSSDFQEAMNFFHYQSANKNIITVISQHRFDKVVSFVKKLLNRNVLGDIVIVNISLKCKRDASYYTDSDWKGRLIFEGGSTVINQAYHLIDLLIFFWGMPLSVKSFVKNIKLKNIIETEDTCVSIMDYGHFLCSFYTTNASITDWETQIEIIGTEGEVSFSIDYPENLIYLRIDKEKEPEYSNDIKRIRDNYSLENTSDINYYGKSHIEQFKNFKNSILHKEKVKVTLIDALNTQKLIALLYNNIR